MALAIQISNRGGTRGTEFASRWTCRGVQAILSFCKAAVVWRPVSERHAHAAATPLGPFGTMNPVDFQLRGVSDPRLAVHATSPLPAWLWSSDGTRVLWANPVGARVFGAANGASLAKKMFAPADVHRRQVAQLARRLAPGGAVRLERLRGFGAALGALMTCFCARIDFAEGGQGILIVTSGAVGRLMPLAERLQRLVEGIDLPVAAFARDGTLVVASEAEPSLLGPDLSQAARHDALTKGRSEMRLGIRHVVLQRVGIGADVALIAFVEPGARQAESLRSAAPAAQHVAAPGDLPLPEYERPAMSGEAPAEFVLIDEFAETEETTQTSAPEPIMSEKPSEPSPLEQDLEPSPFPPGTAVEASSSPAMETPEPREALTLPSTAPQTPAVPAAFEPMPQPRKNPLRFTWQMGADGRFSVSRDEFNQLIGVDAAAASARPWHEIAETFALDPDRRVAQAVATRGTWSGIVLHWPVNGGGHLPVELSGLPIYDHLGHFTGYRGLGVCRDFDELARLETLRRLETANLQSKREAVASGSLALADELALSETPPGITQAIEAVAALEAATPQPAGSDGPAEAPDDPLNNVVPFPIAEGRAPALSAVENSAFNELARQLSVRLESRSGTAAPGANDASPGSQALGETAEKNVEPPNWLADHAPPARGDSGHDRALLDLLPDGVLIYRLDRLIYANRAFLERIGYASLHALEQDGGLDALYVEPGVSSASSTSDTGTPVVISAPQLSADAEDASAIQARLHTISWDGESAHALIFAGSGIAAAPAAASRAAPPCVSAPSASTIEQINAEEPDAAGPTQANARTDLLARISHEIRTPLAAIIGFAEAMTGEQFGALGNARYVEYANDIRSSAERAIALIDGLTDQGRLEAGTPDLGLAPQNLNEIVETCVAAMQPQAGRERIIIRTSLAQMLPPLIADAPALHQIAHNLISNSIHLANAGGQVIVSTALTDFGEVVLRVRDSGRALNDEEIAAAMEPFRTQAPADQSGTGSPASLSATKALAEANRATFQIRTGARSGTLIEVMFSPALN